MILFPKYFSADLLEKYNPRKDTVVWARFRRSLDNFFTNMPLDTSSIFDPLVKSPFPFELPPKIGGNYQVLVDDKLFETVYQNHISDATADQINHDRLRFCIPAFIWACNGLRKEVLQLKKDLHTDYLYFSQFSQLSGEQVPSFAERMSSMQEDVKKLSSKLANGTAFQYRQEKDFTMTPQSYDSKGHRHTRSMEDPGHSTEDIPQSPRRRSFEDRVETFQTLREEFLKFRALWKTRQLGKGETAFHRQVTPRVGTIICCSSCI